MLKSLKDLKLYKEVTKAMDKDDASPVISLFAAKLLARRWIKVIRKKIKTIQELESRPQSPLQKVATKGLDEILVGQIKVLSDFCDISEEVAEAEEFK